MLLVKVMEYSSFVYTVQDEEAIPVEIVFEGAVKMDGDLRSFSKETVLIALNEKPPNKQKCFVRLLVEGREIYSRGQVVSWDGNTVGISLENWLVVLKELIVHSVFTKNSMLERLLAAQKNRKVLESAQPTFDTQRKKNCWEVFQCDKENYCTAATSEKFDGFFGGKNGGRFCAFVSGTSCKDGIPRSDEKKMELCSTCSFFSTILEDILKQIK